MAERKLVVTILGDSRSLERSFTRSTAAANKFGRDMDTGLGRAERRFQSFRNVAAGGFVGGAIATAGIAAFRSVALAAAESQQVLGQTRVALEATGNSWAQYGGQIEKAIKAQSQLGFDDEALLRTFSLFVRRTGDVSKALRDNELAADVARGRFIDLEQAANIVNKAALGQVGSLRRLGIATGDASTGIELLTLLQQKYGNAAEAAGDDAATAYERVQVSTENLKESIGELSQPVLTTLANNLADAAAAASTLVTALERIGAVKIPTIRVPIVGDIGGGEVGDFLKSALGKGLKNVTPASGAFEIAAEAIRSFEEEAESSTPRLAKQFADAMGTFTSNIVKEGAKKTKPIAFGQPGFVPLDPAPLIKGITTRLSEALLDAQISGSQTREFDVLANIRESLLKALTDPRLKAKGRIQIKQALDSVVGQMDSITDEITSTAEEADRRRADKLREARDKARLRRIEAERLAQDLLQQRQFRAIGLAPGGGELVPTVANLRDQLAALDKNLVGQDVSSKLTGRLAGVRKALKGQFGKLTEESRDAIRDLFAAIRQEFDTGTKSTTGPLTKTTSLNTSRILDGLGLGRATEKELRARLSSFNSAGIALAGGTRPTGQFAGGRPIVVENHTTVQLDGEIVGRSVTKTQQKQQRRNPTQKRGPNRGD